MIEIIPFSEDIKKCDGVIVGRVSGWFTKDGTICLQDIIGFLSGTWYIRITGEGVEWPYHREASYLTAFELPSLPCAKKFEVEIITGDNEKLIFELDKREEFLKEAIKEAIEDIVGKEPVVVIAQKEEEWDLIQNHSSKIRSWWKKNGVLYIVEGDQDEERVSN